MKRLMRWAFIPIVIFVIWFMMNAMSDTHAPTLPHHTEKGFRNPTPGVAEHGFGAVFKWAVIERITGKKPPKPEHYEFSVIKNDGHLVRENRSRTSITWIGHATFLIQLDGINILTDPIWSERCSPVSFAGPKRHTAPGIVFENLPPIDIVLISHNHYDHLDKETIKRLGNHPRYFVPLKLKPWFEDLGITNIDEYDWWDNETFKDLTITCTPTQHFSGRGLLDRNETLWGSWVVEGQENKFYFAGDTGYFPGFKEIGEKFTAFDFVLMPIGAYTPRWFMSPVHVDPEEALQAFLDLRGEKMIPMHWGTFDLADEPMDQPPKRLFEIVEQKGIDKQKIWLFKHGETRFLDGE